MKNLMRRYMLFSLLALALLQLVWAQQYGRIQIRYSKREYQISMRDGKRLFTAVCEPKDRARLYPIMLTRTPYGVAPYGVDNYPLSLGPSEEFANEGFIFVYQDVRGRMMSEGEFINVTPHKETKKMPGTSMNPATLTTPSIGWSKTFRTTTVTWGCGVSHTPDFTRLRA
jgi:uncharacterized protein